VAQYYRRLGLGDLLRRPEFGGSEEEPPQFPQPPESPQDPQPCNSAFATDDFQLWNQAPNAEAVGFIETDTINPDMILASVEAASEVREAGARWDSATPSTHYDLVRSATPEAEILVGLHRPNHGSADMRIGRRRRKA
jgi:hypothetical protein